jgi:hypothetical protein
MNRPEHYQSNNGRECTDPTHESHCRVEKLNLG